MSRFLINFTKLLITFTLLAIIAVGAYVWQARLIDAGRLYQSFLADTTLPSGEPLPPQTPRVIVVIIGGFGYDAFLTYDDLPTLDRLRVSGASALMESQPPSYAEPTWLTLLSGVLPANNNAPRLHGQSDHGAVSSIPLSVETIFDNAQRQGLGTALAASTAWQSLISPGQLTSPLFVRFEGAQGDQQLIDNIGPVLENERLALTMIYFSQLDEAGHNSGGVGSPEYENALRQIDTHLKLVLDRIDLNKTTLLILGDYGHISGGGHGGHDIEVLQQPFIMAGKSVIPGTYSPIAQIDIAPTVSTLLGLSLPSANQGRPLVEMIQASEQDHARIMLALSRQRIALTKAYVTSFGVDASDMDDLEMTKADQFFAQGNVSGATELAHLLLQQTETIDQTITARRLSRERALRLILVTGIIFVVVLFAMWRRTELWSYALLSASVVVGTYHGLHRLIQQPYSFSAIDSIEQVWNQTMLGVGIGLGIGFLLYLVLLTLQQYGNSAVIFQSSVELVFYSAIGFLGPVLYSYWLQGMLPGWFFPDMALLYLHFTGLIQTIYVIALGVFAPLIIIPVNALIQYWIAIYQQRQIMKLQARSTRQLS